MTDRASKSRPPLAIEQIRRANFVVEDQMVTLDCISAARSQQIEFSVDLLPRLIALCLHLAGRIPSEETERLGALEPESWAVRDLSDGRVGIEFALPGGSPLMFQIDQAEAKALAAEIFYQFGASNASDLQYSN